MKTQAFVSFLLVFFAKMISGDTLCKRSDSKALRKDSVARKASSTCTNEPADEDLCAVHVPYGYCDWELIG